MDSLLNPGINDTDAQYFLDFIEIYQKINNITDEPYNRRWCELIVQ